VAGLRPLHQIAAHLRDQGPGTAGERNRGQTTAHHRRVGTRLLSRLLQYEEGLRERDFQSGQLEECRRTVGTSYQMIILTTK
jgi:hypothetical protein